MPSGYQAGVNVDIKSTLILSFVTPPVQDDKTQSRKLNTLMKMPSTLIHNVRIFDGDAVLSSDGCVLIKNGLISTVSSVTPELLAEADEVISGAEHTVLPGLIDAHVHCHEGVEELKQALRFGVTTVLDMFSDPEHVRKLRKVAGERNDLSDLRSSCYGATVEGGWPAAVLLATMGDKVRLLFFPVKWSHETMLIDCHRRMN